MNETVSRPRLGRGLSALLGDDADRGTPERAGPVRELPVDLLRPGRFQPRTNFDDAEMAALVESVRAKGIIQPILVRRDPDGGEGYEIVAGERRWRAAQQAQLHEVPVVVRDLDDRAALEVALIENVQREDLSAIEEAQAYRQLIDRFSHTQGALAKAVGKSRSHVANLLRLLELPEAVRGMISGGEISAGHGRALVGRDDAVELARRIVRDGLSVRDIEALTGGKDKKGQKDGKDGKPKRSGEAGKSADTLALERDLSDALGLKVSIAMRGGESSGRGALSIEFANFDQLDDVLKLLNRSGGGAGASAPGNEPAAAAE